MSANVFKKIRFKHLLSFGNLWSEINLEKPGTTLILGENLDEGGSSGAGKTTLISAISYCLFDKIPAGVSKDMLINRTNEKKQTLMEVELTVEISGEEYLIRRWRGSSNGVQLKKGDEDLTPDSMSAFNAKIEDLIGFSYALFTLVFLFSGSDTPFLDLGGGQQRDLIEELLKITRLSKKANALKKLINQTSKNIDLQKLLIKQQQIQNDNYRKHLAQALERVNSWEVKREADLIQLQDELTTLSGIDYDAELAGIEQLNSYVVTLRDYEALAREAKLKNDIIKNETTPAVSELVLLQNQIRTIESEIVRNNNDISKSSKELGHLKDAKCPYCLQSMVDAQSKIENLEQTLEKNNANLEKNQEQLKSLLENVNAKKQEVDKFKETQSVLLEEANLKLTAAQAIANDAYSKYNQAKAELLFTSASELTAMKGSYQVALDRLESLSKDSNPHTDAYEKLVSEGEVVVDQDKLDEFIKLEEHQKFLLKLLTDKNSFIRKNILAKTIPFMNKRIAYYCQSLGLPHVVLFQPDMSCQITQYGRELSHGNLSNGEKKRLNIALALAFRDVKTYMHSKDSLMLVDEIDGGSISGIHVDQLIQLIKKKAWDDELTIFVITHRPEFDGRCDRNLVVRKERGFSAVLEQLEC